MINYTKPILFIDLSYYIFYRFYALCTWVKMSKTECEMNINDVVFRDKYNKCFLDNITKLIKQYKTISENVVIACDCPRNDIWRKQYHDKYKDGREQQSHFDGSVFPFTYEHILPLLINKKYNILKCEHSEADDIIGVLVKKINTCNPNTLIIIITNDNDYLQLLINDNINIFNLKKLNLKSRSIGCYKKDLCYKILVGDKSDNISGIISSKKALTLINDIDDINSLQKHAEEHMNIHMFMFNKRMIDMDEIPSDIQKNILQLLPNY